MEIISKSAMIQKSAQLTEGELALINAQALRPMTGEEVFTFRLAACDTNIDRDFERFTDEALADMAKLYVGRPVLQNHAWNCGSQTARVYAADVEDAGEGKRRGLRCYMPRTQGTAETITAIESGVIRECSVAVRIRRSTCSICGAVQQKAMCPHWAGKEYDGRMCHFDLDDVTDAYEVSLLPVPAQSGAGIVKSKRYGPDEPGGDGGEEPAPQEDVQAPNRAKALLELEHIRYGGNQDEV